MREAEEHEKRAKAGAVPGKIGLLVMTGLLTAMTCVSTMVLVVLFPAGGYVNLGDALVLIGAFLLEPVSGAAAAGIG